MEKEFNTKNLNIVFSVILPGDGKTWPSAGDVLGSPHLILEKFHGPDRKTLDEVFAHCEDLPEDDRLVAIKAFETQAPTLFRRLVEAVTDAYYTTPEVVARVEALANAAPREALAQFDRSLIDTVVRTQAGQYRR